MPGGAGGGGGGGGNSGGGGGGGSAGSSGSTSASSTGHPMTHSGSPLMGRAPAAHGLAPKSVKGMGRTVNRSPRTFGGGKRKGK